MQIRSLILKMHGSYPQAISTETPELTIQSPFSATQLVAAIQGAKADLVKYPEFKHVLQAAGCVNYTVWIAGRHVKYQLHVTEMRLMRFTELICI